MSEDLTFLFVDSKFCRALQKRERNANHQQHHTGLFNRCGWKW
jgi:hypothetical protein